MAPLWKLCLEGKLAEVRAALTRGEDVNGRSRYNVTGLMLAAMLKHNSIVRLLLEQPTVDLNCTDDDGRTALHYAARVDNVEAVRLLLADPRLNTANHENNNGETAVIEAMRNHLFLNHHVNVLHELVGHPSVDLDTTDRCGRSLEEVARWADS